ncbi:MAG: hypothetical protein ACXAC2_07750 [Candidatus Kariarchaeaceae archaeon]|jgi:hypothetical protein
MKRSLTAAVVMVLLVLTAHAQYWPQWRGPNGNGVAAEENYPVTFSGTDDLLWKVQLPGKGSSTPIVWKDRILLTSAIGKGADGEDGVLCFDSCINQQQDSPERRGKPILYR